MTLLQTIRRAIAGPVRAVSEIPPEMVGCYTSITFHEGLAFAVWCDKLKKEKPHLYPAMRRAILQNWPDKGHRTVFLAHPKGEEIPQEITIDTPGGVPVALVYRWSLQDCPKIVVEYVKPKGKS
jgi:hypothetical protein